MPPKTAEALLKNELRVSDLGEVFSDIDLDKPLGAASIAQVRVSCHLDCGKITAVQVHSSCHCFQKQLQLIPRLNALSRSTKHI